MPEENKPVSSDKPSSAPKSGSNNKLLTIIAIVVGVFLVLGIASFFAFGFFAQKAAETITEQATGGKVDISDEGNKVTVETDEGKLTIGKNEVPDSFPSDITVYSGVEVISTTETGTDVSLHLKTSDSVSKVFDFYKSDLTQNGWTQTFETKSQDAATVMAEKNGQQVIILVTTDSSDGKTIISIAVSEISQ